MTDVQDATVRPFWHHVIFRSTGFRMQPREDGFEPTLYDVYDALMADEKRNDLIFEDILACIQEKRSPIIITERREHLEMFAKRLYPFARNLVVFQGAMGKKRRQAAYDQVAALPTHEERFILATSKFIFKDFDAARLDTLFVTLPVSWRGVLPMYAERLRLHYSAPEVRVYDYVDSSVPILARMHRKRMRGYKAIGYEVG